jgi:hypothetical protein
MITLYTGLVQQFYTHQQVRGNQAVMITSLKINFNNFLDEVISKAEFFSGLCQTGKNGCLSHTHTGLKVVLTAFEAFRSKNSKKTKQIWNQHALRILTVFTKLKSDAYRKS